MIVKITATDVNLPNSPPLQIRTKCFFDSMVAKIIFYWTDFS